MRLYKLRLVGLLGFAVLLTVPGVGFAGRKPVVAKKPNMLVTYRFSAEIRRIFRNKKGGPPLPFKVGRKITGEFTYDLLARNLKSHTLERGSNESKQNKISFKYGVLRFQSKGLVRVSTGVHDNSEHFAIGTFNLEVPKGWRLIVPPTSRKKRAGSFGISLQNSSSRLLEMSVLRSRALPKALNHSAFATRELRFHFYHGIRFPGGMVDGSIDIRAELRSFQSVARHRK